MEGQAEENPAEDEVVGVAGKLQAVDRGRELGLGGGVEEKQGKHTLKVSRKGQSGVENEDADGEQGRLILPGKEGQGGEVKVQEEHKEVVQEVRLGAEELEVEEMKAPAPQMQIALILIPLALNLATASASATSLGTRSAGVWVTLSVGEGEGRPEKEQEVVMTSGHVDPMQIALQLTQLALSLDTVSVSVTSLGIRSAGVWAIPYVVEVEEVEAVVAELLEVVELLGVEEGE